LLHEHELAIHSFLQIPDQLELESMTTINHLQDFAQYEIDAE